MKEGTILSHKYILGLKCRILSRTKRGYKTALMEGKKKEKISYFDDVDFDDVKGFWEIVK